MFPLGNPSQIGGTQSVPTSLLRSNSSLLGSQGNQMPSQTALPSLLSTRMQFNNTSNVSSLIHQPYTNGNSTNNGAAEPDPMSNMGSTMSQMMPDQQQQYQSMRGVGAVKLEPQANLGPVKLEPQQLHHQQQQQQQQQLIHMSRQSPQAAAAAQMNYLHQQRLMQLQQQQQQQMALKSVPLQRSSSQIQQQNLPLRPNGRPVYEPGMCARRLTRYMYEQQHRPEDNNIEFWRKFVSEFFAQGAKKKWCVSLYGSGRQTTGVFPQDVWHCEICNRKPGRGFEATAEVLPRLFKIKYESGTVEELLYVDMPKEYQNSSGQIVLDYAKAIQESVFDQLRVVRDGQLRIVFSPELKICSWEFCARRHEELIPRRLLIPQVSQLGAAAQKYQAATQSSPSTMSVPELQNNCNMFVSSARQLAKALEVPLVNDLGYTKRYVRCLQISEVVNSMKDLIDYCRETGTGPMESLAKFPRRSSSTPGFPNQRQINEEPNSQNQQQTIGQTSINYNNNHNNTSTPPNTMQMPSNGVQTVNTPLNASATSSPNTIVGLLHQNSMNPRHQNPNGSYLGNGIQIPSPNTPSTSNTSNQVSHLGNNANDSQSSVQKILQGIMMGPGNSGNADLKNINGFNQSAMFNGIRAAKGSNGNNNNATSLNGRVVGMQNMNQQQGLGDQFLSGLGAVNGFNNLQFDWKPSP